MSNVCADCGREGPEQNGPCKKCGGYRIVSIEFARETFGEHWRDAFKPPPSTEEEGS